MDMSNRLNDTSTMPFMANRNQSSEPTEVVVLSVVTVRAAVLLFLLLAGFITAILVNLIVFAKTTNVNEEREQSDPIIVMEQNEACASNCTLAPNIAYNSYSHGADSEPQQPSCRSPTLATQYEYCKL